MPNISLIAPPGGLDPSLVEALRNAWGGGELRWLAEGEACEFDGLPPSDWRATWDNLQGEGVDLNVVPDGPRRKRLLIADMDSTMIQQECIDEMAAHLGIGSRVAEITARAMNGELDFEAAITERVGLLEGLPEAELATVFEDRVTFMSGAATLLATMKREGAYAALVSGGFTYFTGRVAQSLGFDRHRANTLLVEDGLLTGEVGRPILGQEAKVDALGELIGELGISPSDVVAVGDGANDLGMLHAAGLGVALHAKPAVQAQARIRVNHGDLTALLFLQGYARSEFA
ncbi:MAG: phosphoserine phosphatase SerB [Shimia sp.]